MPSFPLRLVECAEQEKASYPSRETEEPLASRIGEYATYVGANGITGLNTEWPWSAAFVSYMTKLAGADSRFPKSAQHSTYFYRTINARLHGRDEAFHGFRLAELQLMPGDIIGMNRDASAPIAYDWASGNADYSSHADIVVAVDPATDEVATIGGNVGQRIARKRFRWSGGRLTNAASPSQEVFVVIRAVQNF